MTCIPPAWTNSKKRSAPSCEQNSKKRFHAEKDSSVTFVCNSIIHNIQSEEYTFQDPETLFLDKGLLAENVPYIDLLRHIPRECGSHLPIVTRAYEEQYMRSCVGKHEKRCIMELDCECMRIDPSQPFVGTQFIMPIVQDSAMATNLCIVCLRKITQLLFYNVIEKGHRLRHRIQKYGNICNQPGEYHTSAMLICPPNGPVECMPLPIVAHQRNRYSVIVEHGVHKIKQHRVLYEDFL